MVIDSRTVNVVMRYVHSLMIVLIAGCICKWHIM